jgi:hypothetical protein
MLFYILPKEGGNQERLLIKDIYSNYLEIVILRVIN